MLDGYRTLYPGAYAPAGYVSAIRADGRSTLQERYDFRPRATPGAIAAHEAEPDAEQTTNAA